MQERSLVSLLITQENERNKQQAKKKKIKALTEEISSKIQQINLLMEDECDEQFCLDDDDGNTSDDGEIIKLKTSLLNWKKSVNSKLEQDPKGLAIVGGENYYQARDTIFELDECRMILRKEVIRAIFKKVPPELLRNIFLFIDPIDIYQSVSQVSREWLTICENLQFSANLVQKIPVLRLNLKKFCDSPLVGRTLTKLDLSYNDIHNEDIKAITQSKELKNLTSLILCNESLTAKGAEYIAKSKILSNLTELDLDFNYLDDEGVEYIANSHYMSKLTSLKVGDSGLTSQSISAVCSKLKLKTFGVYLNECLSEGIKPICESSKLSKLTDLSIGCNIIEDKGMKIFVNSNNIANLTRLDVSCNIMTDISLILLSNCNKLSNLTDLDIGENDFTIKGMKSFCESKYITKLVTLKAKDLKFGNAGMLMLGSSSNMKNLTHLSLQSNALTEDGLKVFSQSKTFENLKYLDMYGNPCSSGIRHILQSKFLPNLTYLNASSCSIGNDILSKHFNSIELPKLKTLELELNKISSEGVKFIAKHKKLSKVDRIYLGNNSLDPKYERFFSMYPFIRMDRNWDVVI
ncbi:LRR_RI domain-containing protein [Naegleria gruberi]|uniref:LRR_RI domain-containing protein n=1 Tax=Naegleria gruberi TaxID=5762 RepID=D2VVQ1_NAEGR|nr:LRR_RI domain-containing protein [Naegleria gruberi]EFC39082.1 LRR_RI domain-containing protein [Naegleria gruberi]|eukprot:XP_002671826.1 LRR_RI domain-containing protein [Naegleria gruberi strain NEG-M]